MTKYFYTVLFILNYCLASGNLFSSDLGNSDYLIIATMTGKQNKLEKLFGKTMESTASKIIKRYARKKYKKILVLNYEEYRENIDEAIEDIRELLEEREKGHFIDIFMVGHKKEKSSPIPGINNREFYKIFKGHYGTLRSVFSSACIQWGQVTPISNETYLKIKKNGDGQILKDNGFSFYQKKGSPLAIIHKRNKEFNDTLQALGVREYITYANNNHHWFSNVTKLFKKLEKGNWAQSSFEYYEKKNFDKGRPVIVTKSAEHLSSKKIRTLYNFHSQYGYTERVLRKSN